VKPLLERGRSSFAGFLSYCRGLEASSLIAKERVLKRNTSLFLSFSSRYADEDSSEQCEQRFNKLKSARISMSYPPFPVISPPAPVSWAIMQWLFLSVPPVLFVYEKWTHNAQRTSFKTLLTPRTGAFIIYYENHTGKLVWILDVCKSRSFIIQRDAAHYARVISSIAFREGRCSTKLGSFEFISAGRFGSCISQRS